MPGTTQTTSRKRLYNELLRNPETFATTLVTVLIDTYGSEALTWDPETIALELRDDFNVELSAENFDKLMTGISLLTTDEFYLLVPEFISVCNILSGDTYDPRTWDPADAEEVAWGITEAMLLAPPDNEEEPFTQEIRAYIGEVIDMEGIINPPDVLRIALRGSGKNLHNVPGEFSDDPIMFESIYKLEQGKTDAIMGTLRKNLQQLTVQLSTLPLQNGDAKKAIQGLISNIKQ
jgi:hypothetical protein